MYDGWSGDSIHYMTVSASYQSKNIGYHYNLGFYPFEDETSLGRDDLYKYVNINISGFGKNLNNFAAFIGDYCSINISLAANILCLFGGYNNHRLNLAISEIIQLHHTAVKNVILFIKKA